MTKKGATLTDELKSLARGGKMSRATWDDFVARLHHDCVGAGVDRHYTADALFVVESRQFVYGVDEDYGGEPVIYVDDHLFKNPMEFYNDQNEDRRGNMDLCAVTGYGADSFAGCREHTQYDIVRDCDFDDVGVVNRKEYWEYVNSHFTRDAAEAFIARKAHDYRGGLRVNVEAQIYCWEYNAIKEAILSGKLAYVGDE